ncbi:DUF6894 family protein [Rhizobium sp. YIM 134829]|uniref:DUF6894 family protein n=1 Tax=Rhizobium sp. YIM 134829 TaxID=3390453 RepID=UPI00397C195C
MAKLSVRYYLYMIRGDEIIRDMEGEEFESLAEAVDAAQQSLRDMAAEHLTQATRMTMKAIEIYDETGRHQTSVEAVTAIAACLPPWS